MKKICFAIPYLGKWPAWFPIFLETCRRNPTVNWLFFTDCRLPQNPPANVRFVGMELKDITELASRKLGMPVAFHSPYKLTDLKPAHGVIFEDYLKGFDFWGFTDIDLIWGDIRKFLSEDILGRYDVITGRKEFIAGHCTLFRNAGPINRLYEKSPDHRRVFTSEEHFAFTECGHNAAGRPVCFAVLKGADVLDCAAEVQSMSHVVAREAKAGRVKALFKNMVFERREIEAQGRWYIIWDKGCLREKETDKEYLYFHFHMFKNAVNFFAPRWKTVPETFLAGPKGFFTEEMLTPGYWLRIWWLDKWEHFFRSGRPALIRRLLWVLILRWWVSLFDRDDPPAPVPEGPTHDTRIK
ncbi:MAG: DUF6625 family protein [Deltaproteobacteria bacterium]